MSDIRRKVLLDIFASPTTVLPVVGGTSLMLIAWALNLNILWIFAGLVSILSGSGLLATKLVFQIETLTEKAYNAIQLEQEAAKEQELDEFQNSLITKSSTAHRTFCHLREIYSLYKEKQKSSTMFLVSGIGEKVDQLFQSCVEEIKRAVALKSSTRDGSYTKALAEVKKSIDCLEKLVSDSGNMLTHDTKNISLAREELQSSVETMQNSIQRLSEMGISSLPKGE